MPVLSAYECSHNSFYSNSHLMIQCQFSFFSSFTFNSFLPISFQIPFKIHSQVSFRFLTISLSRQVLLSSFAVSFQLLSSYYLFSFSKFLPNTRLDFRLLLHLGTPSSMFPSKYQYNANCQVHTLFPVRCSFLGGSKEGFCQLQIYKFFQFDVPFKFQV